MEYQETQKYQKTQKIQEKLGERLLELRKINGYTQKEVSELLGIDRSAYAKYETGKALPTINNLIKLAKFYGESLDSLCSSSLISSDELQLLNYFRILSEEEQKKILRDAEDKLREQKRIMKE